MACRGDAATYIDPMTDTEIARAQAAMSATVSKDPEVLGAVRLGLLAVPSDQEPAPPIARGTTAGGSYPQLAVRRPA